MAEETTAREMIWNQSTQQWNCWNCGHDEFRQRIVAENFVALSSGDAATLIESDDFVESWEVLDRGATTCVSCAMKAEIPDTVGTVERCEWDGDEGGDTIFGASFKW